MAVKARLDGNALIPIFPEEDEVPDVSLPLSPESAADFRSNPGLVDTIDMVQDWISDSYIRGTSYTIKLTDGRYLYGYRRCSWPRRTSLNKEPKQ